MSDSSQPVPPTTFPGALPSLIVDSEQTISGLGRRLTAGTLTCGQLLNACLEQIAARESELQAWVHVDERGARLQAEACDRLLAGGVRLSPLHGIPIGIKDIIDVAGFPTAAGSAHRAALGPVRMDAPAVQRLRRAGAVIVGKTVTTQYACFDPPPTRNPWDAKSTPGGSSSGSAVAVAAGMCLATLGSQTGGSITRPAAYCGVAGCKPSFGLVSTRGVVPVSPHLDHVGPLARCVADLAVMTEILHGSARHDPGPYLDDPRLLPDLPAGWSLQGACGENPDSSAPSGAVRLGALTGFFRDEADPESLALLERVLVACREAGAIVRDTPLPAVFQDLHAAHRLLMEADLAAVHALDFARTPQDYLPGVRSLIESGQQIPAARYVEALHHQQVARRSAATLFEGLDVLVSLAAPGPPPDASSTGDPRMNAPWSYTGLPTVCVPVGLHPSGLPVAMQVIGAFGSELRLFRCAAWLERLVQNGFASGRLPGAV